MYAKLIQYKKIIDVCFKHFVKIDERIRNNTRDIQRAEVYNII